MNTYQSETEIKFRVLHVLENLRSRHRGQAEGEDGLTLSVRKSLYRDCWSFDFALDVIDPEWTFICEMPHLGKYTREELEALADDVMSKILSTFS